MTPAEIRGSFGELISYYQRSWGNGGAGRAARMLLAALDQNPWLRDQIPDDVLRLAMQDANLSMSGARRAYEQKRDGVLALLELVKERASTEPDERVTWAHVGSMGELRERLMQILITSDTPANGDETATRARIEAAIRREQ